jgi:hypothetical protein
MLERLVGPKPLSKLIKKIIGMQLLLQLAVRQMCLKSESWLFNIINRSWQYSYYAILLTESWKLTFFHSGFP